MTLQASEMLPSETIDGEELANYCEPTVAELLALWKSKRGRSRLPARRAFDFGELKPWLGHIILFDVVPDGLDDGADFRYRLVGSNLTRVLGIDPTGRSVSEFCLTVDPKSALSNLRTIVRNRLP